MGDHGANTSVTIHRQKTQTFDAPFPVLFSGSNPVRILDLEVFRFQDYCKMVQFEFTTKQNFI